jgi:hypothetical protein
LFAVKYKHEVNSFISSWHDRVVGFSEDGSFYDLKHSTDAADAEVVEINFVTFPTGNYVPRGDTSDFYMSLGVRGFELFRPGAVASFGGGDCVAKEFQAYRKRVGNGDWQQPITWHVFPPLERPKASSATGTGHQENEVCMLLEAEDQSGHLKKYC